MSSSKPSTNSTVSTTTSNFAKNNKKYTNKPKYNPNYVPGLSYRDRTTGNGLGGHAKCSTNLVSFFVVKPKQNQKKRAELSIISNG